MISESEWQSKASANSGAVPFYSDGDGSTTFRVPALTVWVKGKNGSEAVGDYLADTFKSHKHNVSVSLADAGGHTHTRGTMNITGTWSTMWNQAVRGFHGLTCSGAFYRTTDTSKPGRITSEDGLANNSQTNGYPNFDASRNWTGETSSNGNHSHTVTLTEATQGGSETRPKTIVGLYCVIAFNTAATLGSVNLDSLQKSINEAKIVIESAIDITRNAPTIADLNDQSSTQIVNAAYLATNNYVVRTYGDQTISGTKTFNNVINGTALNANWADLAEIYQADKLYQPGTLVAFGGENEITIATAEVNAVVSTKPALLMNNEQQGTPIALVGRVPVRVIGKVTKFDKLILDRNNPGVAKVDNEAKQ